MSFFDGFIAICGGIGMVFVGWAIFQSMLGIYAAIKSWRARMELNEKVNKENLKMLHDFENLMSWKGMSSDDLRKLILEWRRPSGLDECDE